LLLFGGATNRVPLSTLGLMQYLTPLAQFIIGYFVFGEQMSSTRWAGFLLVWTALVIFSIDMYRSSRRTVASAASTTLAVTEPD